MHPELRMFDRVVHEWHGQDRVKVHFIHMPASREALKSYTSVISADAFRQCQVKMHYDASQKQQVLPIRFHMILADEYNRDLAGWAAHPNIVKQYQEMPFQTHENLWNFYEFIGWDYKKKKLFSDKKVVKIKLQHKVKP